MFGFITKREHDEIVAKLKAELAVSYVRNERGQIARHPSFRPTVRAGDMGEVA